MTTQEVLSFLKDLGIAFSVWRLNNLVKRGLLKEPVRVQNLAKNSPRLWTMDDVKRVKIYVLLNQCQKRQQSIRGGM